MISPDDAYRLQSQIQTFKLRFSRQCENASKLAIFLNNHPAIERVWFPGLDKHETHSVAKKIFGNNGFGAMITFDLNGRDKAEKKEKRDRFIAGVSDTIKLIPTLGDPHTILMPVEAVWGAKYPEPGMIRLSVGFEDYETLENTISGELK
jgi:cystathionine beta-lyase/cystathionine gamma-synthase